MGDLLIRNIPDRLKREIEAAALKNSRSLSATAIDMLRRGAEAQAAAPMPARSAWDEMRAVFEEAGALDDAYGDIMDAIEAERKTDFGRDVEPKS